MFHAAKKKNDCAKSQHRQKKEYAIFNKKFLAMIGEYVLNLRLGSVPSTGIPFPLQKPQKL